MKKVKAYITIVDELELIRNVLVLVNRYLSDNTQNAIKIPKYLMEYEDEEHVFHYYTDCVIKSFEALNFVRTESETIFRIDENLFIGYKEIPEEENILIQIINKNNLIGE